MEANHSLKCRNSSEHSKMSLLRSSGVGPARCSYNAGNGSPQGLLVPPRLQSLLGYPQPVDCTPRILLALSSRHPLQHGLHKGYHPPVKRHPASQVTSIQCKHAWLHWTLGQALLGLHCNFQTKGPRRHHLAVSHSHMLIEGWVRGSWGCHGCCNMQWQDQARGAGGGGRKTPAITL